MKGSPSSDNGWAAMQSNQSLPLHPWRPCTTADWVMKFLIEGFPGSITGTLRSLYFESSNITLNIELSGATGTKGAHRYDFRIVLTYTYKYHIYLPHAGTTKDSKLSKQGMMWNSSHMNIWWQKIEQRNSNGHNFWSWDHYSYYIL